MTNKLRVGIAGASGWMAGALSVGVEYDEKGFDVKTRKGSKSRLSAVTALCDLKESVMHERKQELGLDSARCFTSYDEMLKSDAVDAVVVAVPNNLHVAFALKALEAGKHLFLEKPFATTAEDSRRLIQATNQSPVTTKLDYILVLYDEQQNLRRLIEQGAFGKLASTHFTYRHPIQVAQSADQIWKLSRVKSGGAVPMGICHAISLTVYQVNAAPQTVICKSSPPKVRAFDYDSQLDMLIVFENGVVGLVQGNIDFAEKYDARHTVIGTEGQFDYNPYNPLESRVMWSSKVLNRAYAPDPKFAHHHLDSGDVWKHQCGRTVQEFVQHALKKEKDPLLGLESPLVRRTEAIIWAAEQSAREGSRPVSVAAYLG
jgi:predicted dehydrogenase